MVLFHDVFFIPSTTVIVNMIDYGFAMYFHTLVSDKFAFRCEKDLETLLNVSLVLL